MEYGPHNPFESPKDPEESGSEKASQKKKKRTTKIPLPSYLKSEKEAEQTKPSSEDNVLEKLFSSTEEKHEDSLEDSDDTDKSPDTEYSDEYDESELAQISGVELPEQIDEEIEQTDSMEDSPNEVLTNQDDSLNQEGEFVDEAPLVISRPRRSFTSEQPTEQRQEATSPETSPNPEFENQVQSVEDEPIETNYELLEEPVEAVQLPEQEAAIQRNIYDNERYYQAKTPTAKAENVITEKESNERAHHAKKQGIRQGVLAGGLAGWWIGRRGKKEALKSAEESKLELEKQDKEIDRLAREQAITKERLTAMQQTKSYLEKAVEKQIPSTQETATTGEQMSKSPEQTAENKPEVIKKPAPEDQEITEETYLVKRGTKVEQSAWHSIEVDEKTGRKIDNPERAYGKEFANEQRQEKLRSQHSDPGLAFQFGHAVIRSTDEDDIALAEGQKSGKKPGAVRSKSAQQITYVKNQVQAQAKNPNIWIAAALIFVLLFAFGILR